MNIIKIISFIQFKKDIEISKKEMAEVVEKTEATLYSYRDKDVPEEWKELIEKHYDIKLPLEDEEMGNLAYRFYDFKYWKNDARVKKDGVTHLYFDAEVLVHDLKVSPENIVFIAMPSNKMDGGERPIRYKDILMIDTFCNNIEDCGIYLYTTNKGKDIFVNIIDKTLGKYLFKYKNIMCKQEEYTTEELKKLDFKVIGRVIHNCSEKL